ncbi:MAG: hypothetical protein ACI3XQ_11410 [Eubacteriales bacterium]
MSEYEIRQSYDTAKSKKQQIKILAQLNDTDECEICRIIGIGTRTPKYRKKSNGDRLYPMWSQEEDTRVIELYRGGTNVKDIAYEIGRTPNAVSKRVVMMRNMGLVGKKENETWKRKAKP